MARKFAQNLRSLCAQTGSIAQTCREIGINRQQFNRYLSGSSMPSAHNLRKIAQYFNIPEEKLLLSPEGEIRNRSAGNLKIKNPVEEAFLLPFQKKSRILARYLGAYHFHFRSPTFEGFIFRGLSRLIQKEDYVECRSLEIVLSPDRNLLHISRYQGLATLRGSYLYIVEHEKEREGCLSQTCLASDHRQQLKYLRGMTIGVSMHLYPKPFASRVIWKRIDPRTPARDAIAALGVYPIQSTAIDPIIRTFLEHARENTPF